MKKQILLRSAIGFPVGVCVCNLILLIIAFFLGTYAPCSPTCTALFGSERTGKPMALRSRICFFIERTSYSPSMDLMWLT